MKKNYYKVIFINRNTSIHSSKEYREFEEARKAYELVRDVINPFECYVAIIDIYSGKNIISYGI